jgi:hypothetical protein
MSNAVHLQLLSDVMKRASGQFESQLVYISQQLDSNSDPDQSDGGTGGQFD